MTSIDPARAFLRHTIATLAYRGAKVLRGVPASFGGLRAVEGANSTRSAAEILAHIGDLLEWTALLVEGDKGWRANRAQSWEIEAERFFAALARVDAALAGTSTPSMPLPTIFQGPIADAFTHLGQISLLRRLAGAPARGEPYVLSEIVAGRVGPEQSPPAREFD